MFIPLPSSAVSDLATAHRPMSPAREYPAITSPDDVHAPTALQPDPIYMGLRAIVTTGPIGWLINRIESWQEEREDRRMNAEGAVVAADRILRQGAAVSPTIDLRERVDHDLAA